MASETPPPGTSLPPPPPGGGGIRYALLGLLLIALAGGLYFAMQLGEGEPEAPPLSEPDAGLATPERSTALVETELEIPDLEPDAGEPDAGEQETTAQTTRRSGTVARDWSTCSGSISAADARRAFSQVNSQIRSCYERQLKQNPVLEGHIDLEVRIGRDGRVAGSQITGSLRDSEVYSCVRGVASRMTFPSPGGNNCAVVRVPYSFTPQR